ncbi:MAG: hypothetical protein JXR26_01120 [Balneolaceae bacterium]|nr:hypothetical protein [Balneolaceae bacterium]
MEFSKQALSDADGKIQPYFFESANTFESPIQLLAAYIPNSDRAMQEMEEWILSKPPKGTIFKTLQEIQASKKDEQISTCYFVEDTRIYIYSSTRGLVMVIGLGHYEGDCGTENGGGGGQGGNGEMDVPCEQQLIPTPDCDPNPSGECPPPYYCGDPPGGDDPPDPPDPCDTGNAALDDTDIQNTMEQLWENSDINAEEFNRREQGAWVIKDPATGEYSIKEFSSAWTRTPCKLIPPENMNLPSNTVGMLHTHPFNTNEKMYSCLGVSESLVQQFKNKFDQIVKKYKNIPSKGDIKFLKDIHDKTGINLDGYIIDENGIKKYDKDTNRNDPSTMTPYDRCGY